MTCLIIYALKLEKGKYYVGKTHRTEGVELRFEEHLTGRGSEWTKLYKPVSIAESYEHDSTFEEDVLTKKYMMKYGIENVRGGSYTKIDLEEWQMKSLEHEFKSVSDKCFKCGKHGHFAKDCDKGLFLEYLSAFGREEKIEEEIARLENVISKINHLDQCISNYRYVKFMNNKKETITIEVEPSIIDTYDMRNLKWDKRQLANNFTVTTSELLYSSILNKADGVNINIMSNGNVVQNIYKVYIYRKKLERQYLQIFTNEGFNLNPNIVTREEFIKNMNNKIELLYEKLSNLFY